MTDIDQAQLDFYTEPGCMTSAGRFAPLLAALPRDIAGLAAVTQGLMIHEHMAQAYGVRLTDAERSSVHVRPAEGLLDLITARDDRPLDVARDPAARLAGNCRHFSVLMTTLLRAQGRPTRARCGFGGYFTPGCYEDHWVCEYWNPSLDRWALVDAQVDERQRGWFGIDFDLTDVPRDRFLVAGRAWDLCRSGAADPARFGLSLISEAGEWWIAGNLMRDAAALLGVEVLPWDTWAAMPGPAEPIPDELAGLLDRLAAVTQAPDEHSADLRRLCQDDRLRVPPAVHNELRARDEPL